MIRNLRLILLLALLGVLVLFVVQNSEALDLQFLIWSFETRRAVLIFAVLVFGFALGWGLKSTLQRRSQPSPPARQAGAGGQAQSKPQS